MPGFILLLIIIILMLQVGNGGLGEGSALARSELTKETGKLEPRAAEPLPSLESALFLTVSLLGSLCLKSNPSVAETLLTRSPPFYKSGN